MSLEGIDRPRPAAAKSAEQPETPRKELPFPLAHLSPNQVHDYFVRVGNFLPHVADELTDPIYGMMRGEVLELVEEAATTKTFDLSVRDRLIKLIDEEYDRLKEEGRIQ